MTAVFKRSRSRGIAALQKANASTIRFKVMKEHRCALGCAFMRAQHFARILDKALPRFGILQKFNNCSFERIGVANLNRSLS